MEAAPASVRWDSRILCRSLFFRFFLALADIETDWQSCERGVLADLVLEIAGSPPIPGRPGHQSEPRSRPQRKRRLRRETHATPKIFRDAQPKHLDGGRQHLSFPAWGCGTLPLPARRFSPADVGAAEDFDSRVDMPFRPRRHRRALQPARFTCCHRPAGTGTSAPLPF